MYSIGFVMKLKPGCYAEYKRRHDALWPEMAKVLSDNRINMVIHCFHDYLFVHGTAPTKEHWENVDRDPIAPQWDTYMKEVMEIGANGQLYCEELPLAFSWGEFK